VQSHVILLEGDPPHLGCNQSDGGKGKEGKKKEEEEKKKIIHAKTGYLLPNLTNFITCPSEGGGGGGNKEKGERGEEKVYQIIADTSLRKKFYSL